MTEQAVRLIILLTAQLLAALPAPMGPARQQTAPPIAAGQAEDAVSVLPPDALGSSSAGAFPAAHVIQDFPLIWQLPELPTGCEVTALAMVLRYSGYDIDKTALAAEYLPVADPCFYYGPDGTLYGPDMSRCFIGDPFGEFGYICGAPAIASAAGRYLSEQGGRHRALDLSGSGPEVLYRLVSRNVPVAVWVTIGMAERQDIKGWYTSTGEYVEWCSDDHGAVLIGYSESTVTLADPVSGFIEYDRGQFEAVFEERGRQCVALEAASGGRPAGAYS